MRIATFDEKLYRRLVEVDAARIRFGNLLFHEEFSERPFGAAIALRNQTRPRDGLFNRVIGFGGAELAALDDVIAFYDAVKIACQIDVCPSHATPELLEALQRAGFRAEGTCSVFHTVPERMSSTNDAIVIDEAVGDAVLEWIDFHRRLGERSALETDERNRRAAFYSQHPEHRLFFASIDGERAAVGALLFHGDACHLSNAHTSNDKRGRGLQQALLRHRLDIAAQRRCTLAVTDTMFGNTSHRNAERVGFRLAYNPTFWVRRNSSS